jgi:hypothetical protein
MTLIEKYPMVVEGAAIAVAVLHSSLAGVMLTRVGIGRISRSGFCNLVTVFTIERSNCSCRDGTYRQLVRNPQSGFGSSPSGPDLRRCRDRGAT